MKCKALTLTIAASLALAATVFFCSLGVAVVKASITLTPDPFTFNSPLNTTYDSRIVPLDVSFVVGSGAGKYTVLCYLDGAYIGTVPFTVSGTEEMHVTYPARGVMDLPALPDGPHSVTVALTWTGNVRGYPSNNDTAYFRIDSDEPEPPPIHIVDLTPPKISLLAPRAVYHVFSVPLSFTVDEVISQAYYSLDNMGNVTVNGNMTLKGMTAGEHSLILYAEDGAGNVGASETAVFTIAEEMKQQPVDPFPTAPIITASGISVASVGLGLLVYFKRRKSQPDGQRVSQESLTNG